MLNVAITVDPPDGVGIRRLDPVAVRFGGALPSSLVIRVRYNGAPGELIYDSDGFTAPFAGRSGYTVGTGYVLFSLARRGGWRTTDFRLSVQVDDSEVTRDPYPVLF